MLNCFSLGLDLIKISAYLFYLSIYLTLSAVSVQIIRDAYLTVQSLAKRAQDLLRHQCAIEYINDRCSDTTAEELAREDFCIVYREEMVAWQQINESKDGPIQVEGWRPKGRATVSLRESSRPKRLPCGHVLHFGCLQIWFGMQTTCPICRRPVHKGTRWGRT